MAISDSLYKKIKDSYNKKIGALGKEIIYFDCYEMSNYLYDLELKKKNQWKQKNRDDE